MTSSHGRGGFMLVTVLIVTGIGLLFGAGTLLLFRYQCQRRIDRQHELEKVYAVRSALNYLRTAEDISGDGKTFRYHTGSERDLGVIVKPVPKIFPSDPNRHLYMEDKEKTFGEFTGTAGYYERRDYEYGSVGVTNLVMGNTDGEGYGLAVSDPVATNGVRWWVNIGMRGTGGWLQEDYGRRYCFFLKTCVGIVDGGHSTAARDLIRLCIIRNVTNENNDVGKKHGWPLSSGERALVFESCPYAGGDNAVMRVYEYVYGKNPDLRVEWEGCGQTLSNLGLQIAGDKVSLFYIDNKAPNNGGYLFSQVAEMTPETYAYFLEGATMDGQGRILSSPDIRAVFEIDACSSLRNGSLDSSQHDFVTNFRVSPAYQYDVFLEHPAFVTNLATVAQKIGEFDRTGIKYTVLTYDTHGTENKGFRKDERDAERKKNWR